MNSSPAGYYLAVNRVQSGPFPQDEVLSRIASGELLPDDLCWQPGWGEWKPLAKAFPASFPNAPATARETATPPTAAARARIEGRALVVPKDTPFPQICVRTGSTENLIAIPIRRILTWHHPALYLTILLSVLIYIVIVLIVRRKSTHTIYLTKEARSSQIKWHLFNWALFLSSAACLFSAIETASGELGMAAILGLIASTIVYSLKVRILYATKIDETHARIAGIPPAVMAKIAEAWR